MARKGQAVASKRRASIADVAAAAGVSNSAVSKVLRNAYGVSPMMRARVEEAIKKLDYRPLTSARAMRGQSHVVGIEIPQLGNEFFTMVIEGVQQRLQETGYTVMIAPPVDGAHCRTALNALVDHQVDGIIAIAPDIAPDELNQIARNTPLVMIGRHDISHQYDSVVGDDENGGTQIMDYLFESGHTKIALLTVKPDLDQEDARQPHTLRRWSYENAMLKAGLEPQVVYAGQGSADVYEKAREILAAADRPTALIAGHDAMAIDALRALHDLGLSRKDVAIIGYDDIDIASHPMISLTSVRQFGDQMGKKAVEMLIERIQGEREAANQLSITPKLVVRQSSSQN
jgi:LacI family transcriptional regulator